MRFGLVRPCATCPFLRTPGGIRLTRERVAGILDVLEPYPAGDIEDGTFQCHETVVYDDDESDSIPAPGDQHCAGALIYLEGTGQRNSMGQIAQRLGLWDPSRLKPSSVFASRAEMLAAQWEE